MLASFFSQPVVWSTSLVELLTLTSIVAFVAGAYRHIECHHSGCHRLGRFPHGQYKLCRIHHPHVPTTGPIDQARIAEVAPAPGAGAPQARPGPVQS
jgi:hypothetical protein